MEYTFDATNKKLGRLASEIAVALMGKKEKDFARHTEAGVTVKVVHASKLDLPQKKKQSKTYKSYSGYPSGLKEKNMTKLISEKGHSEVLRKAVYGMLPGNKLRPRLMKKLNISE